MKRMTTILCIAGLAVTAAACTEAKRARNAAEFGDRPADITCWTYGTETFSGRSTGKVEYNDGGRIAFVDAANGRYTTLDGECRVVYLADDGDAAAATPPPVTNTPET
jgi:outer membrane lipoprotein-sorting protein